MKPATATIYNMQTGASRIVAREQAEVIVRSGAGLWSYAAPIAPGWDREMPRYRVTKAVKPAERSRYRFEKPFSSIGDNDVWQYADRAHAAGETIQTAAWPHPTFVGLNESARRTLQFFTTHQKSRLPLEPFREGRLQLDDGLGGYVGFTPPPLPRLPGVQMPGAR